MIRVLPVPFYDHRWLLPVVPARAAVVATVVMPPTVVAAAMRQDDAASGRTADKNQRAKAQYTLKSHGYLL